MDKIADSLEQSNCITGNISLANDKLTAAQVASLPPILFAKWTNNTVHTFQAICKSTCAGTYFFFLCQKFQQTSTYFCFFSIIARK